MSGNDWQTPDYILELVRQMDPIGLDPCTTADNPTGARQFYTQEDDALTKKWGLSSRLIFCNPPYGRGHMMPWAQKVLDQSLTVGSEIILLTRGDTSTKWARLLIDGADAICFPPRIKFKDSNGSPNFASILWYFGRREALFRHVFRKLGPCR